MFCTVHFDEKMEKMEKSEKVEKGLLFESWVKKVFFANIKKSLNKTGKVERLLNRYELERKRLDAIVVIICTI